MTNNNVRQQVGYDGMTMSRFGGISVLHNWAYSEQSASYLGQVRRIASNSSDLALVGFGSTPISFPTVARQGTSSNDTRHKSILGALIIMGIFFGLTAAMIAWWSGFGALMILAAYASVGSAGLLAVAVGFILLSPVEIIYDDETSSMERN